MTEGAAMSRYAGLTRLPTAGRGAAAYECPCGDTLTTSGGVAAYHAERCRVLHGRREGRCLYVHPLGYRCALDVHPLPGEKGGQLHFIEIIKRSDQSLHTPCDREVRVDEAQHEEPSLFGADDA